ncbi:MAG: DUF924 domain-containing protein [Alphaproteobacteria bacterium]|nr:hypothetical protein [Hyphomonas sp.]MBR9806816.1 DUF924 domain-containing protein [Alphaproteobacteria bacterium]|tara:strand:+ start:513 stop:1124 length:612 start_codon:yes stop_codon:yes gene_type:complete
MTDFPMPNDVLTYWIGETRESADAIEEKHKLWFGKSDETDEEIRTRFLPLLEEMSHLPFADDWAEQGPRQRLATIIVLDQFSRNIFRGNERAFDQDSLALRYCLDGLAYGQDQGLSETERVFFYLPLEHSEKMADQERSVALFTKLAEEAREPFKEFAKSTLDYAEAHKKVIEQFGRFPHRNKALGRESTEEEKEWLAEGGGF